MEIVSMCVYTRARGYTTYLHGHVWRTLCSVSATGARFVQPLNKYNIYVHVHVMCTLLVILMVCVCTPSSVAFNNIKTVHNSFAPHA